MVRKALSHPQHLPNSHSHTPEKEQTKAGCCASHPQCWHLMANGEESLQMFKMKLENSETAHPHSPTAKQSM